MPEKLKYIVFQDEVRKKTSGKMWKLNSEDKNRYYSFHILKTKYSSKIIENKKTDIMFSSLKRQDLAVLPSSCHWRFFVQCLQQWVLKLSKCFTIAIFIAIFGCNLCYVFCFLICFYIIGVLEGSHFLYSTSI